MYEITMSRNDEELQNVETNGAVCVYLNGEGCGVMCATECGAIELFCLIDGLRKMADELEEQLPGKGKAFDLLRQLEELSAAMFGDDEEEEPKVEMTESVMDALAKATAEYLKGEDE